MNKPNTNPCSPAPDSTQECYFCKATVSEAQKMYVFGAEDGTTVPMQVPVCAKCKAEYDAEFAKMEGRHCAACPKEDNET